MDSMDLEREKGITIKSAATHTEWLKDGHSYHINIIDTPGHVDFTIEVERSLQILDGAIMVVCASSGVQSQTVTVDRQCKRYSVPRIIFLNKCDRVGARPLAVVDEIRNELELNAAMVQLPIGVEENHAGLIDLIHAQCIYFDGDNGEHIRVESEIPERYRDEVHEYRMRLLEALAECGDEECEQCYLEERWPEDAAHKLPPLIRRYTCAQQLQPVFVGSAYRNKGIQTLLDGVIEYLPSPLERVHSATNLAIADKEEAAAPENRIVLRACKSDPLLFLAFKLEENQFGQLTWIKVYSGTLKKGQSIVQNTGFVGGLKQGKKLRLNRLVRLHSDEMQDINTAHAGDICAMFGVECMSGATFCGDANGAYGQAALSDLFVPECVVSLSVRPRKKQEMAQFSKAMERFQREDPTFKCTVDDRNSVCVFHGMGELHLQIYLERIQREYGVACEVGRPRVNYKECVTRRTDFDYLHKKQTGGAGQYARIIGYCEPIEMAALNSGAAAFEFVNRVTANAIPAAYIKSVEQGFRDCLDKGPLCGGSVEGLRVVLVDGVTHEVDSSDFAFNAAAKGAFRQLYVEQHLAPRISEPFMSIEVCCPEQFQQAVIGHISSHNKAVINSIAHTGKNTLLKCTNALDAMFGFATSLRSLTQGKGEFSMEYHSHQFVDDDAQVKLVQEYKEMLLNEKENK
eukprot:CAMPEP_0202727862 /NCGR_PEP_ID=MMETSP1385-20130828/185337_1 /ASSEMBLY_ACC=CAM_ASM_000861 /TAXON_ID=933848 /ORGANISM="Elphidium margaritaceum" /LENGTH=685 /DNA_ID=CAMNT_0049394105 /DNA_START=323 /DNA_END=2380 /DNA_ORIENTATION=-